MLCALSFGLANGTVIAEFLEGTDPDEPSQQLYYLIDGQEPGQRNRFTIDIFTGKIMVTTYGSAMLDYETEPEIQFTVIVADDQYPEQLFDKATITIKLTDVNEPPIFHPGQETFSINELVDNSGGNVDLGSFIRATDPDIDDENALMYTIDHTYGDDFPFVLRLSGNSETNQNEAKIELKQNGAIDYETYNAYVIDITATDLGGLNTTFPLTIEIVDEVSELGSILTTSSSKKSSSHQINKYSYQYEMSISISERTPRVLEMWLRFTRQSHLQHSRKRRGWY